MRLKRSDMLSHEEIVQWAKRLKEELLKLGRRFEYIDDDEPSRIAVLQNMERYVDRWIIRP